MDQLKAFGQWMKKNYFWVVCGLVAVLVPGSWFMATGKLQEEASARRSTLQSSESTITSITSTANHPNPFTHEKMDARIDELVNSVYEAWLDQFEKQQHILTWPDLGSEFVSKVKELRPIEQKVKFPAQEELLKGSARQTYRDFIQAELPKLAAIIGAEWSATSTGGSGSGGGGLGGAMAAPAMLTMAGPGGGVASSSAAQSGPQPLVVWESDNQSQILEDRFTWSSRSDNVPSTLEVLYAQEDYWVLRAVMEIVRATNGDISQRYQATIKTIDFIEFGRDAIGLAGEVKPITAQEQGGVMGMAMGMNMGGQNPGQMAGALNAMSQAMDSPNGTAVARVDPGDNRYVDLKLQPIPASKLRAAHDSRNPDDAFLMVAKRIPVRMRVTMDQRKLPKFLSECGNASLQLEVRQLRINMSSGSTAGAAGSRGGSGMAGLTMAGPRPGGMPGGGGPAGLGVVPPPPKENEGPGGLMGGNLGLGVGGPLGGGAGMSDESPYDVQVEVYGVMYIYNPVDMEKLGKKLEEPVAPEGETAPADAPPTAAAPTNDPSSTAATAAG